MFTLLRWAFWSCALAAMIWLVVTVPLGGRTLVQHLRAIAGTQEARSLAQGTRDEAAKAGERLRRGLEPSSPRAPVERLDERDREALERVLRDTTGRTAKDASRSAGATR